MDEIAQHHNPNGMHIPPPPPPPPPSQQPQPQQQQENHDSSQNQNHNQNHNHNQNQSQSQSHQNGNQNQTHIRPHPVDPLTGQPIKRKPGRPKGSGKRPPTELDASSSSKPKRPVGRPRKDGLPAGSVGMRRSNRPRKSPGKAGSPSVVGPGMGYPNFFVQPWQGGMSYGPGSVSAPHANGQHPFGAFAIEPMLNRDEWAHLSRTNPDAFLQTLLSALAAPHPVSTAGPSVEEAFKSHLNSLSPSASQNKDVHAIPSLYSILKTFWLPSSPAYFSLTASTSTARTPSEHRFLYWDPQPLVFNGINCPFCSAPLQNRGRIRSGPIKVYDLEKPFFIIGCEYICASTACVNNANAHAHALVGGSGSSGSGGGGGGGKNDVRRFASTDFSILRALPARLKDEFPAHLLTGVADMGSGAQVWNWRAMGVSRSLWNMVRGCLRSGMGKDAILQVVEAIQKGVPEDAETGEGDLEEEEEEEGDLQHMADHDLQGGVSSEVVQTGSASVGGADVNSSEEYNNAWKANSALVDSDSSPTQNSTQQASQHGSMVAPPPAPPPPLPAAPQHQQFTFAAPPPPLVAYPYGSYAYFHQHVPPPQQQHSPQPPAPQPADTLPHTHTHTHTHTRTPTVTVDQTVLKRAFNVVEPNAGATATSEVAILEPSQKRTRHCCKCGSQDCKGKGGRSFCLQPCQDCGRIECKGRNSRRPDKTCAEAWN